VHSRAACDGRHRRGLLASGRTIEDVLAAYPYLERDDVFAALAYAASRAEAVEVKLGAA
jgi:uncharacterized protein (DUF433 family)